MKPEAPPSSAAILMMVGEVVEGHARGQDGPRSVQDSRLADAAGGEHGILQLEQVDVQVVEGAGRLDDGILASLALQVLPGRAYTRFSMTTGTPVARPIADDLFADGESLGDQVSSPGPGPVEAGRSARSWRGRT